MALALAAATTLAQAPVETGYRKAPTSELLIPASLAEDAPSSTPRPRRQAGLIGRGFALDPWPFIEGVPQHPGYGLNPRRVVTIFRESELGVMRTLQDLYDDLLESDGHLRALFESRIGALSGKGHTIQEGSNDAASIAARDALASALEEHEADLVELLEHQLEAQFRGFSASEIIWEQRDGIWVPVAFDNVAHRRFSFQPGTNELRLIVSGAMSFLPTGVLGEALLPDKWVVSKARHSNLARSGLFRTATWWALFKRLAVRDWIVFAERFGIPHTIGYYQENASEQSKAALELALKDLGEGGQAILSELTKVVIEGSQRSGDANSVHPQIVRVCDNEISKLINGATLTADSGGGSGSYALARVHENRSLVGELADANRLQRTWRRYIARPFCNINGYAAAGAKPPRLNIQVFPSLQPKERVDILSTLVNDLGMQVDGWHVAEALGFRRPKSPADAALPTKKPALDPDADAKEDEDDDMGDDK